MSKNKIGEDSPIPKFIYLKIKIRRRDGVKSLTTLEEGEFKVPIDSCIRGKWIPHSPMQCWNVQMCSVFSKVTQH